MHKEATRNYELDTTISHERKQSGVINRQTVAVAVKSRSSVNPDTGEVTYTPLSEADLNSIRQVLIGTVGYSENRGDLLNVLSMPFAEPEMEQIVMSQFGNIQTSTIGFVGSPVPWLSSSSFWC